MHSGWAKTMPMAKSKTGSSCLGAARTVPRFAFGFTKRGVEVEERTGHETAAETTHKLRPKAVKAVTRMLVRQGVHRGGTARPRFRGTEGDNPGTTPSPPLRSACVLVVSGCACSRATGGGEMTVAGARLQPSRPGLIVLDAQTQRSKHWAILRCPFGTTPMDCS